MLREQPRYKLNKMKIRAATPADVPAMMALEAHAATAAHWQRAAYERMFAAETPSRVALVLEEDGNLAAFIVALAEGNEWEIENIAVAGAARRRGLGSRLLGEFLDMARARGVEKIALEVRESNQAARALYEKWAFVESGRRPAYYAEPAEAAVVYSFRFAEEGSR